MERINRARLKRLLSEREWCGEEVSSYQQQEYQVILELLGDFPVKLLCGKIGIQRNSFYNWKQTSINGWIKTEIFIDLHIMVEKAVGQEVEEYIVFFNKERPAYSPNYLTPLQYKEKFASSEYSGISKML